jgi:hypothetical protein
MCIQRPSDNHACRSQYIGSAGIQNETEYKHLNMFCNQSTVVLTASNDTFDTNKLNHYFIFTI